ncbi:MAG: GNAT family N-acetyltransferase [Candidatus Eisenbacteria bacterium]|uniref:GNAT family N-acetyltransferase n=1 Tax=Eiseniibacteriota bacterium TaxID=2212470 RepID=A0A849SUZ3_UNCEI|nr:GNAT family N-acetyltransferase [Candidatus Eisenbacteria bacterium]
MTEAPDAARWFERAPSAWDALVEHDVAAGPAHRSGFVDALAATTPGATAGYLIVGPEHEPAGGMPVLIMRRAGFESIHALPHLLPGTPLARDGQHERVDHACAAALASLLATRRAIGGEWVVARGKGRSVAVLERVAGETRSMERAIVDLDHGIEVALRRVDRHARQEMAVARRRGVEVAEAPEALEHAHALYASQARAWHGHRPLPIELARRLLGNDSAGVPLARLYVARDARGILSAVQVLVGAHEWFAWWSGSRAEARRRSAFSVLMWHLAEEAARHGARRFNAGASAQSASVEAFKRSLGARTESVGVRWITPTHASSVGRALFAIQRWSRSARARGTPEAGFERAPDMERSP